ncbi:MAG TPA: LacI family DNA-binding transcriptional regulator [Agriterribacter sp.]|nr:LacI family DNA-binding transcriptional regulator [Agriterribacter sp.]HRQ49681.1 LacI family DNA-binding transcriptional regulator [Agriterribacter sp.]
MSNLKDVARLAAVSIATVSRVINNYPLVDPETRTRVQNAIRKLNFHPNRVARRLSKLRMKEGNGKIIGLVLPDISNPFYVDVLRGVEDYALKHEYVVITCNFGQDASREKHYLSILQSESIDGLVVVPVRGLDEEVSKMVESGLPIVCVDRELSGTDVDVVLVDNRKGAYEAVQHLIRLGHKRIAFISGLPQIPTSIERLNGYKDALQAHKIPVDEKLVKYGNSMHESGLRLSEELLKSKPLPTALFTGNNLITLGALEMIHRLGLSIPGDIALVGFDDMHWSISLNPPLTAVRQPGYDIGTRATELLFQRIADMKRPTAKVIFNAELKIRNSCGSA